MAKIDTLIRASIAKEDEFYTRMPDIERELKHYKNHFKNKIIFCNCDDPEESNFWKYFYLNFAHLELKELISTHYDANKPTYKLVYDGVTITKTDLTQNGDFRSTECLELLKYCDIVITNPPFSLWIPYINQIMEHKKDFLILGNPNALKYKDVFPYIKNNKIWFGYKSMSEDMLFDVTQEHAQELLSQKKLGSGYKIIDGKVVGRAPAIWYTNLDIKKRHEFMILYKKYTPEDYLKYDNFDAINIDVVSEIPMDYDGYMGVPISFMDSYNPEQFEIIGYGVGNLAKEIGVKKNFRGRSDLAYTKDGVHKCPYARIIIRRKCQ